MKLVFSVNTSLKTENDTERNLKNKRSFKNQSLLFQEGSTSHINAKC